MVVLEINQESLYLQVFLSIENHIIYNNVERNCIYREIHLWPSHKEKIMNRVALERTFGQRISCVVNEIRFFEIMNISKCNEPKQFSFFSLSRATEQKGFHFFFASDRCDDQSPLWFPTLTPKKMKWFQLNGHNESICFRHWKKKKIGRNIEGHLVIHANHLIVVYVHHILLANPFPVHAHAATSCITNNILFPVGRWGMNSKNAEAFLRM